MLRVDKSLSYLNDMLHHPRMFRLDAIKKVYVSKSSLNANVRLDATTLFLPYSLAHYHAIQTNLHSNREFMIFLVFKLLERGVYISARNVAVLESTRVLIRATNSTKQTCEESVDVDAHSVHANMSLRSKTRRSGEEESCPQRKIVHCDEIAFNAKKRHVYVIVVCDHSSRFPQCRIHALRVADSIAHIIPEYSTVVPCVLKVYNFQHDGIMRLCTVTDVVQSSVQSIFPGTCVEPSHALVRKKPRLSQCIPTKN